MLAWIKALWRKPLRLYVFPIAFPDGGHVRDHHVWARSELQAMKAVRECYDLGAFVIGPAKQSD